MTNEQKKIIEEALSQYATHCTRLAVQQRGKRNPLPGETMTRKYKDGLERLEEIKEKWSKRADEVFETIYAFDDLMGSSLEKTMQKWMYWSVKKFEKATSFSSLDKAEQELQELKEQLVYGIDPKWKLYEYADVIMCLLHSAAKEGFKVDDIIGAFEEKASVNYSREWILDPNGNTYSHKK